MNGRERRSVHEQRKFATEMSFKIFYGAHGSAKDIEGVAKVLKDTDIFIPELIGWTQEHIRYFRGLSNGAITPREFLGQFRAGGARYAISTDAALGLCNAVYNTHKLITFADIPAGHPMVARFVQIASSGFKIDKSFEQTLINVKSHLKEIAVLNLERENYVLSHLRPAIEQLLLANPNLARKQKIQALLFSGAIHTRVHHALERSGAEVSVMFSHKPFRYFFSNESVRRYIFGKEVNDELAAKSFMDMVVLQPGLKKITSDFYKVSLYIRRALSGLTLDEINAVFQEIMQKRSYALFISLLEQKGIAIPQTERELDDFLASS